MTATIINFPTREQVDVGPDSEARDCRNCVNARFGPLTHCVLVGEDILDEVQTARSCEAYELDEEM